MDLFIKFLIYFYILEFTNEEIDLNFDIKLKYFIELIKNSDNYINFVSLQSQKKLLKHDSSSFIMDI